jgi:hypothetical protein
LRDAVDDFLPGAGFAGSCAMCGQALFEERLLPLMERHVVGGRRDAIPQRLHVIDLVALAEIARLGRSIHKILIERAVPNEPRVHVKVGDF